MTDQRQDIASEDAAQHAAGAALIEAAFAQSRESGSEHWDRMTTAVLKNRILSITKRSFDESDWGARSFRDFVGLFPELVRIDASVRPAQVALVEPADLTDPEISMDDPKKRIRRDLWEAVLDFSNEDVYVWHDGHARLVSPEDAPPADAPDRLPTITADEFDRWRGAFVDEAVAAGASPRTIENLQLWQSERRPDWMLPRFLRRRWNAKLKQLVLDVLTAWFETNHEHPPADLIGESRLDRRPTASRGDSEADRLRATIIDLVSVMTREELEELRFPPGAFVRLKR